MATRLGGEDTEVEIIVDSKIAAGSIRGEMRNTRHLDTLQRLQRWVIIACRRVELQWAWTKGHLGDIGNEGVDECVNKGRAGFCRAWTEMKQPQWHLTGQCQEQRGWPL